ncbi:hypothetical protein HJC23_002722 [Cyclotella cryptica]|uniref:Uncharacterized protein n=1 Tax=Cyclotella cryptica TaxID=29204 RepID=A0ABD3PC82_9STRA|eukprot:CCRYP_016065-RA/>CCRYP_016065-RA protein AED:0.35 eAED:0.35 QI:0/-1/0/1/-1/1/1/0/546
MSQYANGRYDPSRRRRRPLHVQASPFHAAAGLAAAAAVAYGAYRLGSLAWNSFRDGEDDRDYDDEEENEDILYEWNNEKRRGRNQATEDDSPRSSYRSRRSRGDWSELNHRRRSHRPSPKEDYHHRSFENGATRNEMISNGMKGVVSNDASDLGPAVFSARTGMPSSISEEEGDGGIPNISPIVRNSRMARCRTEASRAMIDFLPTLKKAVAMETDVGTETEELKLLRVQRRERNEGEGSNDEERSRERELWNAIKNKSVTRLVTTVYAHSIVFLVLTVQVNLLGGRLLREEVGDAILPENQSAGVDRYRSSHQMVLAKTYQHVFSKGIPCLAKAVSKVVDEVLKAWDVLGSVDDGSCGEKKNSVTIHDVSSWINQIRDEIERPLKKGMSPSSALAQYIIPEEDEDIQNESHNEATEDELAKYILDETYDLLESPTFANAERKCLDATFSHLHDDGYAKLFSPLSQNGGAFTADDAETIPLANVVTHLQKVTVSTFYRPPSKKDEIESWGGVFGMMEEPLPSDANAFIPMLERLNAVLELGHVCFD